MRSAIGHASSWSVILCWRGKNVYPTWCFNLHISQIYTFKGLPSYTIMVSGVIVTLKKRFVAFDGKVVWDPFDYHAF